MHRPVLLPLAMKLRFRELESVATSALGDQAQHSLAFFPLVRWPR
jgi:hypothetical protein